MKVLVIGYGSIGKKHVNAAKSLDYSVEVVSSQNLTDMTCWSTLEQVNDLSSFDIVIIANSTHAHKSTYDKLLQLDFNKSILIEKPVFDKLEPGVENRANTFVAYNLRFHPLIQKLKQELKNTEVVSAQCYVGSYLPDWRPNQDYRTTYSAQKSMGGGVLRDLSHELDYLTWIFGQPQKVFGVCSKKSALEIDVEDTVQGVIHFTQDLDANFEMNYTDRNTQRFLNVVTNTDSFRIDLVGNTFSRNGSVEVIDFNVLESYSLQLQAIANNSPEICSLAEGLGVLNLIHKIESSNDKQAWEVM